MFQNSVSWKTGWDMENKVLIICIWQPNVNQRTMWSYFNVAQHCNQIICCLCTWTQWQITGGVFFSIFAPFWPTNVCFMFHFCLGWHIKMSQSADTQKRSFRTREREKLTFNRIMSISEYFIPFTRTGVNLWQNMKKKTWLILIKLMFF